MSKAMTGVGDFVMGTNAKIWNPTVTGGTSSGQTHTNATLSGTTMNSGTISGGTVAGSTVSGGTLTGTTTNSGTINGGNVSGAAISTGSISNTSVDNTAIGQTTPANARFNNVIAINQLDLSNAPTIYMAGQTFGTHAYPAANFPGTTLIHIPIQLKSAGIWYTAWLVASW